MSSDLSPRIPYLPDVRSLLVHFEGWQRHPYRDGGGRWTVGVGHCIATNPLPGWILLPRIGTENTNRYLADPLDRNFVNYAADVLRNGLAPEEVFALLDHDLRMCDLTPANLPPLSPPREAALKTMVFNMGIGAFLGFNDFLGFVRDGAWTDAARDLLVNTLWAQQVPARAKLTAEIIALGVWPDGRPKDEWHVP